MPIGNLIVLGSIVAVFVIFMAVLAAVAWWSERGPRQPSAAPARARPAAQSGSIRINT